MADDQLSAAPNTRDRPPGDEFLEFARGACDSADFARWSLSNSPDRPPDWRWRLVCRVALRPQLRRYVKDRFLKEVIALAQDGSEPTSPWEPRSVFTAARALYLERNSASTGHALETRVLAGQAPAEIAIATGVTLPIVSAYESVFFDVRDRLPFPSLVLHCIDYRTPASDFTRHSLNAIQRLAYFGGPLVADELLNLKPAHSHLSGSAAIRASTLLELRQKAAIAAQLLPVETDKDRKQVLKLYFWMQRRSGRLRQRLEAHAQLLHRPTRRPVTSKQVPPVGDRTAKLLLDPTLACECHLDGWLGPSCSCSGLPQPIDRVEPDYEVAKSSRNSP